MWCGVVCDVVCGPCGGSVEWCVVVWCCCALMFGVGV